MIAPNDWSNFLDVDVTEKFDSIELFNNIFYAPDSFGAGSSVLEFGSTDEAVIATDNNIWFIPNKNTDLFRINSIWYEFNGWQALGFDVSSIDTDPLLLDPATGDFRLQSSSPAKDTGSSDVAPYLRIDADGTPRPRGRT